MSGFSDPVAGGGGALVRPSLHSPDYVPGSTGWSINKDGSSEFSNGTFRGTVTGSTFEGADYVINSAGMFFYRTSTPGLGDLIASVAPAAGTDAYGNNYLGGIAVYDPSGLHFVQMISSSMLLGNLPSAGGLPDTVDAAILAATGVSGFIEMLSGVNPSGGFPDALRLTLGPGKNSQPRGSLNSPIFTISDQSGSSYVTTLACGPVVAAGLTGSAFTWQTPVFNTGWAAGSTASALYQPLVYRFTAENELWLFGAAHATAAAPANTVFTLPADYAPHPTGATGTASIFGAGALVSTLSTDVIKQTGRLNVQTSGAVVVGMGSAIASGDNFYFDHKIPLGDIE